MTQENQPDNRPFTVLVVDDEAGLLEVLSLDFEMSGCRVLTASSGNQAIEILKAGTEVDVILTDVRMPDGDGVELLRQAKVLKPGIPVILMTGFAGLTLEQAQALGAETVVCKPFDLDELNQTVLGFRNLKVSQQ